MIEENEVNNEPPINSTNHFIPPEMNIPPKPIHPKNSNIGTLLLIVGILVIVLLVILVFIDTKKTANDTNIKNTGTSNQTTLVPAQVSITNKGFEPESITIKVNQAVVWKNNDSNNHQVNSDPYPMDNNLSTFNDDQAITPNSTYSYIFAKVGSYPYHDNLNPYTYKGTVTVEK